MTISNEVVSISQAEVSSTAFTQPWDSHAHTHAYASICIALKQKWKQVIKKIKNPVNRQTGLIICLSLKRHRCIVGGAYAWQCHPARLETRGAGQRLMFVFVWIGTQGQSSTPRPARVFTGDDNIYPSADTLEDWGVALAHTDAFNIFSCTKMAFLDRCAQLC